jgi:FkbM family methyltransferase
MIFINRLIGNLIRKAGYQISRMPNKLGSGEKYFLEDEISVTFDVGANIGDFALDLRKIGYKGKIYSFEPLSKAYKILAERAGQDSFEWKTFNLALGEKDIESEINVSANSESSSLMGMLPYHSEIAPESKYVDKEKISVKSLNSIFPELCSGKEKIWLKIDTQGYEFNILEGGDRILKYIDYLQLEMSFVPLYENQMLFDEMHDYLIRKGFIRVSIQPVFMDFNTGQILQVDGIYKRAYNNNII